MTEQTEQYGALTVDVRTRRGKGVSRKIRQQGLIPGVVYGGGGDSISLRVDPNALETALDPALEYNTLLSLTLKDEGKPDSTLYCMVADLQVDPLRDTPIHIDFLRVDPEQQIVRNVPVRLVGRPAGVVEGGILNGYLRYVRVEAKPANIPSEVEVDVTALVINQSLRVSEIAVASGRLLEDPSTVVAHVSAPKAEVEEETPAEGEGEGEPGAEGAAAEGEGAAEGGDKPAGEAAGDAGKKPASS